jgi:hypothetical protein
MIFITLILASGWLGRGLDKRKIRRPEINPLNAGQRFLVVYLQSGAASKPLVDFTE